MVELYITFLEDEDGEPRQNLDVDMVNYCYKISSPDSKLVRLIRDLVVQYWHLDSFVTYSYSNRAKWEALWEDHPNLRHEILLWTNTPEEDRGAYITNLEVYLD
ncbi:hypothetical protein NX059_006267 [Plenodomus lindquistii]|nr:hypothetical protein NX059_006267 [Plenodomus lindquistii]